MNRKVRLKIQDSIYYLDDGQISIYKENQDHCIIEQKSKKRKNYQIEVIGKLDQEGNPPIYIDRQKDNIELYINENRSFDIYCYTGEEILNGGINLLDIPKKKSSIVIGNGERKEHIYLESVKKENKDDDNKKYKNDLLNPYENKNIGTYLNSDIDDLGNIVNILQKSESARYLEKGGSRIVFKIKNKSDFDFLKDSDGSIIKVARNDHNISTNRRENQTWQAVRGTEIGKYFCPITNHGPEHKYIVMEEANGVKDQSKEYQEIANRISTNIKQSIKKPGGFEYDPVKHDLIESMILYDYDITADNVGKYKDRYVLVDYPFGALITIEDKP